RAPDRAPGGRPRAALALLQARGVNLLVLDEPTNHLDLPAIEQLEAALVTYPGTFLLVTHDRRMLQAVSGTRRPGVRVVQGTESAACRPATPPPRCTSRPLPQHKSSQAALPLAVALLTRKSSGLNPSSRW